MNAIDLFDERKCRTVNILNELLAFVEDGDKYGLSFDASLIDKIRNSLDEVSNKKMKIVLTGGFSEGKTSIAAAISENYDPSTMKISQEESSDEIEIYNYDDRYQIVDTPGLFGYKEDKNKEKYRDKTKKYISEADLVIYVISPDNPIKDSHRNILKWLFVDLGLLPRTVFVMNKFDEEIDIEDEDEYRETYNIRKKNIIDRLTEFGILNSNQDIQIVAISANPYDKGIEKWLGSIEEYRKLSKIDKLVESTYKVVKSNGGKNEIVMSKQRSVIKDILNKSIPLIEKTVEESFCEVNNLENMNNDFKTQLENLNLKISKTRVLLKEYINELFSDLIIQINGQSLETIDEFFEREIGDEGVVLQTKIENEFESQVGSLYEDIMNFDISIDTEIKRYNSIMEKMFFDAVSKGTTFIKSGCVNITNADVLKVRDVLFSSIKFKPWQAVKIAERITEGLAIFGSILGIGLDVWQSFSENKKKVELENLKNKIKQNFNEQRKEYLNLINDDNFQERFFPSYSKLKEQIRLIDNEIYEKRQFAESFEAWKKRGNIIDAEFRALN